MAETIPESVLQAADYIASRTAGFSAEEVLRSRANFDGALFAAKRHLQAQRNPTTHPRWMNLNSAAQTVKEWFDAANA